ncbi:hypothetical protein KQY27_03055 [Methanobrevibacter sp. TMH8]|nr:hypothetical protein [Methanobrevibacter sp. TMH8]
MKFSDDEYDEKSNKSIAVILGIFCGITIAYLASNNIDAAYIFLGILIGNAIALKIDGIHHVATLFTFLILFIIWGIFGTNGNILTGFSIITLAICMISALIDEWGNDNITLYEKNKFLKIFFDYRFAMKIAIFILAILGLYQSFTGFTLAYVDFLNISTFVFFILFELFYEFAGFIFNKYFIEN